LAVLIQKYQTQPYIFFPKARWKASNYNLFKDLVSINVKQSAVIYARNCPFIVQNKTNVLQKRQKKARNNLFRAEFHLGRWRRQSLSVQYCLEPTMNEVYHKNGALQDICVKF